jgi:hypothetical protein
VCHGCGKRSLLRAAFQPVENQQTETPAEDLAMAIGHAESFESKSAQAAAYGGLIDAVGGVATVILAIIALTGLDQAMMSAIATVVFGGALLIQAGTILSEYAHAMYPTGTAVISTERFGSGGLSMMFLVGAGGIILGVLALLGIASSTLTAVAVIAYGSALVLSSNSVKQLQLLQSVPTPRATTPTGSELLADEMASGSAGVQVVVGLAAIVLGILAAAGGNPGVLTVIALLVLGASLVLTGSTLSGLVLSFMCPAHPSASATTRSPVS